MKQLDEDFSSIDRRFQQNFSKKANFYELYQLFEEIKKEVLAQWDITLVNDLYAFVFTGLLKKMTSTDVQAEIAGIEQIESMKPVIALEEIR
jgi:pyruvate,water dikinase